jgi:hypothetical protein
MDRSPEVFCRNCFDSGITFEGEFCGCNEGNNAAQAQYEADASAAEQEAMEEAYSYEQWCIAQSEGHWA